MPVDSPRYNAWSASSIPLVSMQGWSPKYLLNGVYLFAYRNYSPVHIVFLTMLLWVKMMPEHATVGFTCYMNNVNEDVWNPLISLHAIPPHLMRQRRRLRSPLPFQRNIRRNVKPLASITGGFQRHRFFPADEQAAVDRITPRRVYPHQCSRTKCRKTNLFQTWKISGCARQFIFLHLSCRRPERAQARRVSPFLLKICRQLVHVEIKGRGRPAYMKDEVLTLCKHAFHRHRQCSGIRISSGRTSV